jgi:hypothetical protein
VDFFPGLEYLNLEKVPHLQELEVVFFRGRHSALSMAKTMNHVVALILKSESLRCFTLKFPHEQIRKDPLPGFVWDRLDEVLHEKNIEAKIWVPGAHQFISSTVAGEIHEDVGWSKALVRCSTRGLLEFRPITGE